MLRILEIIPENKALRPFLQHIEWNFLAKLKKDKAVRKVVKLRIDFYFDKIDEEFIVESIRGNQDRICFMDVAVNDSINKNDLAKLSCKIIEHFYKLNDWDTTVLEQLKTDVLENNYIVEQSILKKTLNADLKFEIACSIKEQFIDYFVVVTNKKTKESTRFTFLQATINLYLINYLLNKFEVVSDGLVITDVRGEIVIKLDLYGLKTDVSFNPIDHTPEFLKRYYESFKYDYPYKDQSELFVKYVNA